MSVKKNNLTNHEKLGIIIKDCKTSLELFKKVNLYFNTNNINDVYSNALQRKLKKQTDFNKALQDVWNYILNSEMPMKMHDVGKARWKGTAIHGMECSNPNR